MSGFRVLICGGGIAAVEGLLRLRRLTGDACEVRLVSPTEEMRHRPLSVQEPFARAGPRVYPLHRIAAETGSEWIRDALEWVDPQEQVVHTVEGLALPYDALLVATGARTAVPYEHVTVFDDSHADESYRGLVQDVEEGYTTGLALLLPEGPAWPLPLYELALMTAERARSMGMDGLQVDLVTAERAPLDVFGAEAGAAVARLLERAGVTLHLGSRAQVPGPVGCWSSLRGPSWHRAASWRCRASRARRSEVYPALSAASLRSTTAAGYLAWADGCSRRGMPPTTP